MHKMKKDREVNCRLAIQSVSQSLKALRQVADSRQSTVWAKTNLFHTSITLPTAGIKIQNSLLNNALILSDS